MPIFYIVVAIIAFYIIAYIIRTIANVIGSAIDFLGVVATYVLYGVLILVGVAIAVYIICFLYALFKDPGKRFLKKSAASLEAHRQQILLHRELKRKLCSEQKIAKAEAFASVAELHQKLKGALANSEQAKELEELRIESEIRVMKAKMGEIDSIINEFKQAEQLVVKENDLNSKEKIELLKNIRSRVSIPATM